MEGNMNNTQRGQNNNMTRNENKKNGKAKNIAIAAGIATLAIGGFFLVKKIRAKKQEKAQLAAEKDAE
jgi:hypothetical protein